LEFWTIAERRRSRSQIDRVANNPEFREEFLRLRSHHPTGNGEAAHSLSERVRKPGDDGAERSEGSRQHPGDLVALLKGRGPLKTQVLCYQCVTGTTDHMDLGTGFGCKIDF
jgi:hypothetical protein